MRQSRMSNKIIKFVVLTLVVLICSALARATTITGTTITSGDGQLLTNSTIIAEFVPAPGTFGSPVIPSVTTTTDTSGNFTMTLTDVNTINPRGATWKFTICPNASVPCSVISNIIITGTSQEIGGVLSAGINSISINSQTIIPKAYADSEIPVTISNSGSLYWNVSSKTGRIWDGNIWSNLLSSGSSNTFRIPPVGIVNAPGYNAFGDSITCGTAANNTSSTCSNLGYVDIIAPYFSGTMTNYGTSGAQACDLARLQIYPNINPQDSNNPISSMMAGTNDVNSRGSVLNHNLSYQACMMANMTWLTIPRTAKLFGQDINVTKTGTWSNDNTILAGLGIQSTTSGDSLDFDIINGPIYIGYRVIDGNGGTASITIDGVLQGTLNGFGYDLINTINGVTDSIFVNRYAASTGTHHIHITLTSTTGAGNIFSFLWAGSPVAPHGYGFPHLLQLGVTREQFGTNDTLTGIYDGYVQTLVTQLFNDGLWINLVPVHNILDVNNDFFNQSHPLLIGHQKISNAVLGVAQPTGGGLTLASIFPSTITTVEDSSSTYTGTSAATNEIKPGINFYKNKTAPGNAAGRSYSKLADTLNYIIDYVPTGWGGWKKCSYPSGTALSIATQLTCGFTISPSGGLTATSLNISGTSVLAGLQTSGSPNPVTPGGATLGTSANPWSAVNIGSDSTHRSFLSTLATTALAQNLPNIAGTITMDIGNGTANLGTAAIAAGACATDVTVASTNVLTSDSIYWAFNAAPPTTYNGLNIHVYVTAGNVNFRVCNPTAGSITPTSATLNWRVTR